MDADGEGALGADAVGVVGFVVVARRERGDEAGGVSLSLSLREDVEGRRKSDANLLCFAGVVCACISEGRALDDGS